MEPSLPSDFANEFSRLTPLQQAEVLGFMRQFQVPSQSRETETPESRRQAILSLVGSISKEDLAIMSRVIEEDCERIDADGW